MAAHQCSLPINVSESVVRKCMAQRHNLHKPGSSPKKSRTQTSCSFIHQRDRPHHLAMNNPKPPMLN